jgi:hypothetical protein
MQRLHDRIQLFTFLHNLDGTPRQANAREQSQGSDRNVSDLEADAVFNHNMWADDHEDERGTPCDPDSRNHALEGEQPIRAWTPFRFDQRQGEILHQAVALRSLCCGQSQQHSR